jgi:hypothetical protein
MNACRNPFLASHICRVAAMLLLCGSVHGQGKDDFIIVNSGRPVAAAVVELLKRYPVVITYEDPRYTYAGDLKDVTEQIRNPQAPPRNDGPRVLVPVGGQLQVRYAVSSLTNEPASLESALESIVEAKAALPAGGRFRVERSGSVFHVVASQVRDPSGQWVEHTSVLDAPLTLKTGELNGVDMIRAIVDEVSARSGVKFGFNAIRVMRVLADYRGAVEANNEVAREVMLRTLQGIDERLTWLLYYDPLMQGYALNIVATSADPTIEFRGEPRSRARPGDVSPVGRPVPDRSEPE